MSIHGFTDSVYSKGSFGGKLGLPSMEQIKRELDTIRKQIDAILDPDKRARAYYAFLELRDSLTN